jgi:uncharacterized protein (TIGR00725 family)
MKTFSAATLVAVIGSSKPTGPSRAVAYEVGREIIRAGYTLVCGGLGGVMEAACEGASAEAGRGTGRIVGILPGTEKNHANPYVDIALPTGIGHARNAVIACAADALIAVSGEGGTLSEIALAWAYGKPIVVMENLPGIVPQLAGRSLDLSEGPRRVLGARSAAEAVGMIQGLLSKG